MIYWFKYMPEKIMYDKELFPVIKNKWIRNNTILFANALSIVFIIAFHLFYENPVKIFIEVISPIFMIPVLLIGLVFILFIHELLHSAVVLGKDDMSVTFNKGAIFIITNAELSKAHWFIFISLPLIALTIIPFGVSFFIADDIASILRYISVLNLALSLIDIINIPNIITKPKDAVFWRGMYYIPDK